MADILEDTAVLSDLDAAVAVWNEPDTASDIMPGWTVDDILQHAG